MSLIEFLARRFDMVPLAGVRRMEVEHRAQKAALRDVIAVKDAEIISLRAKAATAETARTLNIVGGVVPRAEHDRVVAELATLRRAWEHGISFVAAGDRTTRPERTVA